MGDFSFCRLDVCQRARLARRVDDADYPFPEIFDYVAGVVVRDFR